MLRLDLDVARLPLRAAERLVDHDLAVREGKALAARLQDAVNILNVTEVGRGYSSLGGDYYILNCSDYPSAIVECGFLSNAEDEKLLMQEEYRLRLVGAIADGLERFLYSDAE